MATSFPLPNMPLEWFKAESWLEQFEFYISSAGLNDDKKKATFLANCGTEAFDLVRNLLRPLKLTSDSVIYNFPTNGDDKKSILKNITDHLKLKTILHFGRYNFFSSKQTSLSINQFVAELRNFAATFEHGELKENLLLTQFIIGVENTKLKERFLSKANLLNPQFKKLYL